MVNHLAETTNLPVAACDRAGRLGGAHFPVVTRLTHGPDQPVLPTAQPSQPSRELAPQHLARVNLALRAGCPVSYCSSLTSRNGSPDAGLAERPRTKVSSDADVLNEDRAENGAQILATLSHELTDRCSRGFDRPYLTA